MARDQARRLATCRHFHGVQNKCGAGYDLQAIRGGLPCIKAAPWNRNNPEPCPDYVAQTLEDIEREDKEFEDAFKLAMQGISPCCKAQIVKRDNVHFCSQCKQLVMRTCSR